MHLVRSCSAGCSIDVGWLHLVERTAVGVPQPRISFSLSLSLSPSLSLVYPCSCEGFSLLKVITLTIGRLWRLKPTTHSTQTERRSD